MILNGARFVPVIVMWVKVKDITTPILHLRLGWVYVDKIYVFCYDACYYIFVILFIIHTYTPTFWGHFFIFCTWVHTHSLIIRGFSKRIERSSFIWKVFFSAFGSIWRQINGKISGKSILLQARKKHLLKLEIFIKYFLSNF